MFFLGDTNERCQVGLWDESVLVCVTSELKWRKSYKTSKVVNLICKYVSYNLRNAMHAILVVKRAEEML